MESGLLCELVLLESFSFHPYCKLCWFVYSVFECALGNHQLYQDTHGYDTKVAAVYQQPDKTLTLTSKVCVAAANEVTSIQWFPNCSSVWFRRKCSRSPFPSNSAPTCSAIDHKQVILTLGFSAKQQWWWSSPPSVRPWLWLKLDFPNVALISHFFTAVRVAQHWSFHSLKKTWCQPLYRWSHFIRLLWLCDRSHCSFI